MFILLSMSTEENGRNTNVSQMKRERVQINNPWAGKAQHSKDRTMSPSVSSDTMQHRCNNTFNNRSQEIALHIHISMV